MSVRTRIFYDELRRIVDRPGELLLEGATVGECLDDLVRRYPQAKPVMFDSSGRLHRRFYVFVNQESMRKADMAQPVTDRDTLLLVALASGG